MDRRRFIGTGLIAGVAATTGFPAFASGSSALARRYEMVTRIIVAGGQGPVDLWVPLLQTRAGQHRLAQDWTGSGRLLPLDDASGAEMLQFRFDGEGAGEVEIRESIAVEDRWAGEASSTNAPQLGSAERAHWLRLESDPADRAIIAETAQRITAGLSGDAQKARAIHDWVVASTWRDPAVKACGTGEAGEMLREGRMGGKCADINSLTVCLARAAGIPAREMFGIRLAPSLIAASMGAEDDITGAQHCRAEVWLENIGWLPLDPADVRKVMLSENLELGDPRVVALTDRLFGFAEGNWAAYNSLTGLELAGAPHQPPYRFLMYPTAMSNRGVLGEGQLTYKITARPLAA